MVAVQTTPTQCPYCGVGCGLLADVEDGRLVGVRGDRHHPANRGRTCRKPLGLPFAVHAPDRATVPLWREDRDARFEPAGWDDVLGTLAARLRAIVDEHGPDAIAFYISGQLLTEDYYAINKLAKGFLATNNVDSNSRLCMSSAVAGYTGAFGYDGPPPAYEDIAHADCFLLLGTNAAACHPILWSRIRDRQAEGAFVICADPRETQTARGSDLHLPVRPGTDLALLNGLLHVIERDGLLDQDFVARHTSGWEACRDVARTWAPARAAEVCGVGAELIEQAAHRFAGAGAAMALWSMGANQSTVGTLKNRALINLCLASGQIGRRGAGPLSLTGQPNAMGGRETGGLAHLLPGYRKVAEPADRAAMEAHWGVPAGTLSPAPGLPAVELFEALEAGRVKAVWIMATNPLVSLPDGQRARAALERAELVVVQDPHHPTETSSLAHAVLPAAAWPEKEGTMTSSERRIGLVRRAVAPPGEARPDWEIVAGLARHLGFGQAFAWPDAAAVFDEFAACTAGRPCDLSGVSHARLRQEGGLQWPCPAVAAGDPHAGTPRLYADHRFPTPDGRARFAPTPHADPAEVPDPDFPLLLTTGRVADQWHTMTRTGHSPALRASAGAPTLSCHPLDAQAAGLADGAPARIVSRRGELRLAVSCDDTLPRGVAFAPFHWGHLHAAAGAGVLNALTIAAVDPTSAQPELKALAVRLEPVRRRDEPVRRRAPARPRRLVVVGTGMAGLAVVEEALRRRPAKDWRIVMLGEEPGPAYNRVLLSKLLARTCGPGELELRPLSWYRAHEVDLRGGCAAAALDLDGRRVVDEAGEPHPYDALVLATGSRPFVPPVPGVDLPHVDAFRTWRDVDALAASPPGTRTVVVGGGLLGLEAAAGLRACGARVTVVELGERLMGQQLDAGAAATLRRALEAQGMTFVLGRSAARIERDRVVLDDGSELEATRVVVAAGVRAETSLARAAGIACNRGIVVDDALRTSAPSVWSVGECAEHRGTVYGLWAPLAEQARVAGAGVAGDPGVFHGAVQVTTLKVSGVDVYSGGASAGAIAAEHDEIVHSDTRRGIYSRLVLEGDRLVGASLVGDASAARRMSDLLRSGEDVPSELLAGGGASGAPLQLDPAATVCSCNEVTVGDVQAAIRRDGLSTVAQVGRQTRATTGCGGCTADVQALLASAAAGADA
ncbi:MAG: sulfite reductase flavoprotein alpha-component [Solirubrobacteraceae bacterium]|nr:sulfite reductase flavoprotein alpha-component [Solirubrobacteraceae bacterium]